MPRADGRSAAFAGRPFLGDCTAVRLHKLELYGFKSFADKTDFEFDQGITVFCGPNGCGKSNVVDAVRWVLGEQSAKSLRGSEMADVIFSGTPNRKSLGFAEVSLTILNDRKLLPVEYDEVRVTRRLYRSGDSEYLINMQPARLKDIRELFMDTGIGMDAYSVMEQGKIDLLLTSNPAERRSVFEEAAGISKYKARKKAALAKLERVEQNLLRLGDIIEEVEKQLRSVKRQASAARRYKEALDLANARKLELALHRYHELMVSIAGVEREIAATRDKVQALRASGEVKEAERSAIETEAVELDKKIARVESADAEIQSQITAAEEAVTMNRERMQELLLSESKYTSEINSLANRLGDTKREAERSQEELGAIDRDVADEAAKLQEQTEVIKAMAEECAALARDVEKQRIVTMDLMRMVSSHQNRMSSLDTERASLEGQKARIEQRAAQREAELAQIEERIARDLAEIEGLSKQLETDQELLAGKQARRNDVKTRVEQLGEQIAEKRNVLAARESRRQVLEDLERKHEGLTQGVVGILKEIQSGSGAVTGVRGMVADLMQADLDYAPALEAALGDAAQHLVTESTDHSLRAVEYLKQTQTGRATFLPMDRVEAEEHPPLPETNGSFVGRAHELIQCADEHRRLFGRLLRNTLIVRDLPGALEMSSNGFRSFRLVTLGGEIIDPAGPITGGTSNGRTGVISRKSELRSIAAEVERIKAEVAALQQEYAERAHERDALEVEIDDLRTAIHQATVTLAERRKEQSRLADARERAAEEIRTAQSEVAEIGRGLDRIQAQAAELQGQLQELRAKEQAARAEIDAIEARRREKDSQRSQLDAQAIERKVHIARQRERCESLKFAIERCRRNVQELESSIDRDRREIELCGLRRKDSAAVIEKKQAEIDRLMAERETYRTQSIDLQNRRAGLAQSLKALQEALHALRAEIEAAEEAAHQLELRLSETRLRADNLDETTREQHHVSLAERHQGYAEPEGADWDAVRAEIEDLQGKIERMGNVNLNAIDEQEQLETRFSFLTSQVQDLVSAKNSLQDVIRKINKTSREMFEQTFNAVRENFAIVFRKLFGGGKADIILEEDKDILEAGIEIIARSPGKEPRSISLLSGGEKSLTAVALLFAIFQSKPSPFCILDEVDAALDESNVDRFVGMVNELQLGSQFVIITHSRRTMASANTIYGITMQEPGVSKRIAMRFEDIESAPQPAEQGVA